MTTAAWTLGAETPFEREFKQLREQRDKAVASAIDPIHRRYQASLEQLLRRATQGGDLETAIKLKAELQSPNTAAASSASTIATSKDTKSDDNAAPILAGTSWMTADRLYKVTFFDKAEVEVVWSTGPSRYQYTITKTKARGEWLITIPTTAGYHFRYEKAGKTLIGDDKNIYTKES